jgi:hypothetical protein
VTTSTTSRPQPSDAQDSFAEALAEDFASVEVRMARDGIAVVTGHEPLDPNFSGFRCFEVDEDGEPLSIDARIARKRARSAALMASLDGVLAFLPVLSGENAEAYTAQVEHARASILDEVWALLGCNRDEVADPDVWQVGIATRRLTTKGGLVYEPGDVLLMRRHAQPGESSAFTSTFSPRRLGLVSVPLGYVRAA